MGTTLDQGIRFLIQVLNKYADKSGGENIMRKRNLKELIENEMNVGPILQKPQYRRLMAELERNENDEVDFGESMDILRRVSITEGTASN